MTTRKLLQRIGIVAAILTAVSLVIYLLLPFYWGDTTQTVKFEHYRQNSERYNAVFLGGSLEYRHIDPSVIDSVLQKKGIDFRSYNIAIDGHNIVQEMTDLDGVLAIHNPNLKYIFISVSSEPYFFTANLHTAKWVGWHSATSTYRALRILPTLDDPVKTRAKFSAFYVMSWMENFFKIGVLPEAIHYAKNKTQFDKAYLGIHQDGFYPYDYEADRAFMEYKWEDTLIRQSRVEYEGNAPKRDSLTQSILHSFEQYKGNEIPNQALLKTCMEAYEKCTKRGIQVFFVLPPKGRTNYSLLLPVFNALPQGTQIEVADPRKYPEYYAVENGYNFHHLNFKGARLQSLEMARQLSQRLQPEVSGE